MLFNLVFWVFVLFASLAVLIFSASKFTDYASKIGASFGIPPFIIGVTIVAFGTSLPELATALISVFTQVSEIASGTVVGSNITNILLVVGISAIFAKKMNISWDLLEVDLPLLVGSAFLLFFIAMDGVIVFWEAVILLLGFLLYLRYVIVIHKENGGPDETAQKCSKFAFVGLFACPILIFLSANYTVEAIKGISFEMGLATSAIALTAVALATSLPELAASLAAAVKKNYDVALGNALGSNILNTFLVLGLPGLFAPILFDAQVLAIGLPFMIAATLLYLFAAQDRKVFDHEGYLFLLIYAVYIAKIFGFF